MIRRLLEIFQVVWPLIRGGGHGRFAASLVLTGGALAVGASVFQTIVLHLFGIALNEAGYEYGDWLEPVIRIFGLFTILLGVVVYYLGAPREASKPVGTFYSADINEGWTFRDFIDSTSRTYGSPAVYEGFTEEELSAPLEVRRLEGRDFLEAVRNLRHVVATSNFPSYVVSEDNSVITLRVCRG